MQIISIDLQDAKICLVSAPSLLTFELKMPSSIKL